MVKKRGCLTSFVIGGVVLLGIVGAVVGYSLLSPPTTRPTVLISTPRSTERAAVDQEIVIHAVARDDNKIKRVELWVNDKLQDAQNSNVPGGMASFPLMTTWRPPISGTHTLTVRAFNARGERGHASIRLQAIPKTDRDNDTVLDAIDACPDQPGAADARGCPVARPSDRDGDGIADRNDACPSEPGTLFAQGCPDADGDGVRDPDDTCPREPGSPERNGCPIPGDADGDGVADASDACPREPGSAQLAGCPDRDGDGVRDRDDACPSVPGLPALAGCPDRDGDGVRDALDLCPAIAGPASNSGCPVTSAGDSDSDGVRDDVDLVPNEAGPPEQGGSPPPGRGADRNGNRIPDDAESSEELPRLLGVVPLPGFVGDLLPQPVPIPPQKIVVPTVVQPLEFQVSGDYDGVYCYVGLAAAPADPLAPINPPMTRYPWDGEVLWSLSPMGERRWNLEYYVGEVPVAADTDFGLDVRVECQGYYDPGTGLTRPFDLGSFARRHPADPDWDGHVITAPSQGGADGNSFTVKYRICSPSCQAATFQSPRLYLLRNGIPMLHVDDPVLTWGWDGDRANIDGFKLYVNGSQVANYSAQPYFRSARSLAPACGERRAIYLTAYRGDRESAPSNTVNWNGAPCPDRVSIRFLTLRAFDLEPRYGENVIGPIYGTLHAAGTNYVSFGLEAPSLWRLRSDHTYSFREMNSGFDLDPVLFVDVAPAPFTFAWCVTLWDREPGNTPNRLLFETCKSRPYEDIPPVRHPGVNPRTPVYSSSAYPQGIFYYDVLIQRLAEP